MEALCSVPCTVKPVTWIDYSTTRLCVLASSNQPAQRLLVPRATLGVRDGAFEVQHDAIQVDPRA